MPDPATRTTNGQFLPGQSGNPAGRPRGARNKASVLRDMLDDAEAEALARAVVDRALAGEWPALRICFTRLCPPAKDAPVDMGLPEIVSISDAIAAGSAVIAAMAAGEITPCEAQKVMAVLAAQTRMIETGLRKRQDDAVASSAPAEGADAVAPAETGSAVYVAEADEAAACISPVFPVATEAQTEPVGAPPANGHASIEEAEVVPTDGIAAESACITPLISVAADQTAASGPAAPTVVEPPKNVALRKASARITARALASAAPVAGDGPPLSDPGLVPFLASPARSRGLHGVKAQGTCISPVSGGDQRAPGARPEADPGAPEACPERSQRDDRASWRRAGGMTQSDHPELSRREPVFSARQRRAADRKRKFASPLAARPTRTGHQPDPSPFSAARPPAAGAGQSPAPLRSTAAASAS